MKKLLILSAIMIFSLFTACKVSTEESSLLGGDKELPPDNLFKNHQLVTIACTNDSKDGIIASTKSQTFSNKKLTCSVSMSVSDLFIRSNEETESSWLTRFKELFVKKERYAYEVCLFNSLIECQQNFKSQNQEKIIPLKFVQDSNPPIIRAQFKSDTNITSLFILKVKYRGNDGYNSDDQTLLYPYPARVNGNGRVVDFKDSTKKK